MFALYARQARGEDVRKALRSAACARFWTNPRLLEPRAASTSDRAPEPPTVSTDPRFYFVTMGDDSLKGVGIRKGDTLKLRRSVTFWDGDLVAAETPGGLFVAYFRYAEGGRVSLHVGPEQPAKHSYLRREVKVLGVYRRDERAGGPAASEEWPEYIEDRRAI